MSRAKLLQTIYSANKQRVLEILGWTEEAYYDLILDMGMKYMSEVLGMPDAQCMSLSKRRMYWLWWINHWNIRDADIFLPVAFRLPDPAMTYHNIHQPNFMIGHPSAAVMEADYDNAIQKMNKASQKHTQNARNTKRQRSGT